MSITTEQVTETLRFEREKCTRCGGTGKHSYCQMHGSTCFKCGGAGEALTKRGAAANDMMKKMLKRRVSDLKPGDAFVSEDFFAGKKRRVVFTETRPAHPVISNGKEVVSVTVMATFRDEAAKGVMTCYPSSTVQLWPNKEEKRHFLRRAIAYQNTLTKSGKPSKRAKKTEA